MSTLELNNIREVYKAKNMETVVLENMNFSVEKSEFIAIIGEPGSGKTTLLNVISTLDRQTNSRVILDDKSISTLKESKAMKFRGEKLGFVFQDFNLLDIFTDRDSILLPMVLSDYKPEEVEKRLSEIQGSLGTESPVSKYPHEVSDGQRRRTVIARALTTKPGLILADEPTDTLDLKSSDMILDLFIETNKLGRTILMVTHPVKAVSFSNRVIFIKDGVVFHGIYKGNSDSKEFMERVSGSLTVINNRGVDSEF